MIWFGWVLWHIKHCRLFNAKSFLYIYTKYISFGWIRFYGISTIVGYLMPNAVYLEKKVEKPKVSLFNGISTLFRLFNAKAIYLEER